MSNIPEWRTRFLKLWDKAVDSAGYEKTEWQDCERAIMDGMREEIPKCGWCGMPVFSNTACITLKSTGKKFHINCVEITL